MTTIHLIFAFKRVACFHSTNSLLPPPLADAAESEGQLPNHCGSPLKSLLLEKKTTTPTVVEVPSLLANSQCDWNLERRSEQSPALDKGKVYFEVYASVLLA